MTGVQTCALPISCNPDPEFSVSVRRGFVRIKDPSGAITEIGEGERMGCDPTHCKAGVGDATFTSHDDALFNAQAESLRIPTTTTSSSTTSTTRKILPSTSTSIP